MKTTFTNEFGNEIVIGARILSKKRFCNINIKGPYSRTELLITVEEARRLHKILGLLLRL